MSNQFLSEIHSHISQSILESKVAAKAAEQNGDEKHRKFYRGKLTELISIREFLDTHFNLNTHRYY